LKKYILALSLLAGMAVPAICLAETSSLSPELQAYRDAVKFLEESAEVSKARSMAKSEDEMERLADKDPNSEMWNKSLKVLALSPSEQGDKYLAELAFLQLDGFMGEDFDCATSVRLERHGKAFLKHLREARDNYEKMNPCNSTEFKNLLSCLSKERYAKLVKDYKPYADKPADYSDVDCPQILE
jgi:hypothetical protein